MLRIRTELKQTMMSYQELFEKSIVWGRQKMVESETGWEDLVARRNKLLEELKMLRKLKSDWETEVAVVTKQMEDLHQEQLQEQVTEMQRYNRVNTQLKMQLQLMPQEFLPEEFMSQQQD